MKVLYIGRGGANTTSRHRADALRRVGHDVVLADPYGAVSPHLDSTLSAAVHFRSGYRLLGNLINAWVRHVVSEQKERIDLIWIDSGELLGSKSVDLLRGLGAPVVLYSIDDPTGNRDGRRFDQVLQAIPSYHLCVVVREASAREFAVMGARNVFLVNRSYDEVAHRRYDSIEEINESFRSDVAFVGTWMRGEARDDFLLSLIHSGVNLAIWGSRWSKARQWPRIKPYWRGPALSGRNYVAALQGSKVALGLLSEGNRDLHTTRTFEIPYAGGLLCAQRTSEHTGFYREGEEAMFWDDVGECARVCKELLGQNDMREQIRARGYARVLEGQFGNEAMCCNVIERVKGLTQ